MNKNITISKKLLVGIVFLAVAVSGIGGAFAQYQASLAKEQNAVSIQAWDGSEVGVINEASWVPANAVNMQPGKVVAKDPLVDLDDSKSFDAWVVMKVTIPKTDAKLGKETEWTKHEIVTCDWNTNFTKLTEVESDASKIYYYGYNTAVSKGGATEKLFTKITVPNFTAVKADVSTTVDVDAKVVQKEGYATIQAAWDGNWKDSHGWS